MGYNILAADDEEIVRDIIEETLNIKGHSVTTVEDGEKCLEVLRDAAKKPDVILLDMNMPGKTGLDVLRSVKSQKETADIPVIILTGVSDPNVVVETIKNGAADYIKKPIEPEQLIARLSVQLPFDYNFDDLRSALSNLQLEDQSLFKQMGLGQYEPSDYNAYQTVYEDLKLCVVLSNKVSPKDLLTIPEDQAQSVTHIYKKNLNKWSQVWPNKRIATMEEQDNEFDLVNYLESRN